MSSFFVRDVSMNVQMAKTDRIKVWGMLYCGGAAPVMKALEEIQNEFGLDYAAESFAW